MVLGSKSLKDIKAYASSKKPPLLNFDADFDENAQTQALAIL